MKQDVVIINRECLKEGMDKIKSKFKKLLETDDDYKYINERIIVEIKVYPFEGYDK